MAGVKTYKLSNTWIDICVYMYISMGIRLIYSSTKILSVGNIMKRSLLYGLIFGGVVIAALASILLSSPQPVIAQYVVGGELETPQISKGFDYSTLLIVGGVAAASILIGLYVASRMKGSEQ
jgi:hypothetical protein